MRNRFTACMIQIIILSFLFASSLWAADPIVIGVPTSTGFLEGKECLKSVQLAVQEINENGGVKIGNDHRLFKVESLDIRDAAPGVPVPEALLGIEKIILEKKPTALVVGPFRSEALMAGMDIIAKYKVPLLGTIAMSPASEAKIKQNPDKYKYIFRTCLNAKYLVKYLAGTMAFIKGQFGFNKVYIVNQDVAWARKTAEIITKVYFEKAGWEVVGHESFPTGTSDFSSALMKVKATGAHVILPIFDMPQSGTLVKQWNTMQVPSLMAGFISPLAGPGAWNTFDKKIGGAVNCNFEMGSAVSSDKVPLSKTFAAAYEKKWGTKLEAGHGPAPSYESVYILAQAIERANSLDADAIVAELEKTNRSGVMGRIQFDDGHQAIYDMDPDKAALAAVFQWSDTGKRTLVFPTSVAEGKIQLPKGLTAIKE
ncbi:MAG: ABC transporter substrate-binding protein [Proteobacteria bacterium]|nr:ABC transporter substrate-binding protein [Pseudomonadota bacterium]MBU1584793.1 ABC transporter substrate-binding protein [Pseudomonadota bacterium]MBU2629516.1 ABC transporter substrate-binding protein [Pseudomonadota bacterium]